MALRDKLKRLQKTVHAKLAYVEMRGGGRYWFEPEQAHVDLFLHASNSARADFEGEPRPDPPEILRVAAHAKDRRSTIEWLYPQGLSASFCAYDLEALVETGELAPRPFAPGFKVVEH
jgi:hypothetical protein